MKALFINGSPRKNFNTAQILDKAIEGAQAAGAETERIDLYSLNYKGCMSCFACKLKNSKTNGVCAIKDDLRPVLEKAVDADVIVIGSPIYYNCVTGMTRSFMERLLFPVGSYMLDENGKPMNFHKKVLPTALIYTMNVPEEYLKGSIRFSFGILINLKIIRNMPSTCSKKRTKPDTEMRIFPLICRMPLIWANAL